MNIYYKYKKYFIVSIIVIILVILAFNYFLNDNSKTNLISYDTTTTTESTNFYVDVKGAVKKPGVYEFKDGDRVIDAITASGGITTKGSTSNINLSQKLVSEMVVYVYTKTEIKNGSNSMSCNTSCSSETIEVDNCYNTSSSTTNSKININTASLSELMTLSGIGESKAQAIIDYREKNGNFASIEDILNVSGIGDSTYNNIKDNITI